MKAFLPDLAEEKKWVNEGKKGLDFPAWCGISMKLSEVGSLIN